MCISVFTNYTFQTSIVLDSQKSSREGVLETKKETLNICHRLHLNVFDLAFPNLQKWKISTISQITYSAGTQSCPCEGDRGVGVCVALICFTNTWESLKVSGLLYHG